jgi:putative ABC transport system permease protein
MFNSFGNSDCLITYLKPYTLHITLYDVAFFGMLCIGVTFILLLWFARKANRSANRYLAMALAVVVLWISRILAIDIGLNAYITLWDRLPLQFSLAFGPFIYLYVLKITRPDYQFGRRDLLHFSPLALAISANIFEIRERNLLNILAFISVAIYLYLCRLLITNFYQQQKFTGGDRYRHELRWMQNLLSGFGLVWLLWIPFAAIAYFYYPGQSGAQAYYPLYLLLMALLILMAARALLRPEIGAAEGTLPILKPLLPKELREKAVWLKKVVKEPHYYQDPELTLTSLARKLGLHTHELSRIMNTVLKKSFTDFINEYRVQAAARKMQDPGYDHITLLGIAFESGFNSQSSFNRIFKQITGKSPVEYKNNLKKEYPSYNLGSPAQLAAVSLNHETTPKWLHGKLNRNYMFKNYFKIAWRNLTRHKGYSAINITGLAVGIAVCIMIFIIIQYQTSFDTFHAKKERTYRVLTKYHHANTYGKDVPFPIPTGLKTAFPQIEQVAQIYASQNDQVFVQGNNGIVKVYKEHRGVFFVEPSFFKIFDFPLLAGSYESLKDPHNVMLTKEVAEKYFGDWKVAMGKTIKLEPGAFIFDHGWDILKVSGILAPLPTNTDFKLKLVVAFGAGSTGEVMAKSTDWDATTADFGCYLLLPPNTSVANFNQQLAAYSHKVKSPDNKDSHVIQPLSEVHYDTQAGNYSGKTISHELINVLWMIAAFILIIACVNFINLSTAQAVNRAKEVGVRKVLGSNKSQLQIQFVVETFLIVTGAVLFAAIITTFTLPYVNQFLELTLSFNLFTDPSIILFLLAVIIVVTLLAGFYPSIVLSRFNPVNALKKVTASADKGISLRRGLVVFQFVIAQALIIGTLVIVKQMDLFMNQSLGFDKDAIVNVPFRIDSLRGSRIDYLKDQLLAVNGVQAVSVSSNTPAEDVNDIWSTLKFDHATKEAGFQAITKFADTGYISTYKLHLIAGRNLRPSGLTREFLINESLMKSLGITNPDDILNKEISIWTDRIKCPVVGVLKDFNDRSFRHEVAPLLITTNGTMYSQAGIKLATTNMSATLKSVKQLFEQTFPDFVYEYKFLDEKIGGFYKQEDQLAQLYKIFAAIAIFLSCLGLYGLASFMAVQRVKEVGIRKVLGASTANIVYLFSKEFMVLIAIAFAIAAPIAWYYMHQWLQAYVYRINISLWLFAAAGLASIIIALATISFKAIKAAIANPVKSLRSE